MKNALFLVRFLVVFSCIFLLVACSTNDPVTPGNTAVSNKKSELSFKDKIAVQEEIIKRQEEELAQQAREIEDLKRQKYHNDSLRRYE